MEVIARAQKLIATANADEVGTEFSDTVAAVSGKR